MEIVRHDHGNVVELRIKGRLDSYWSDYFARALNEVLHEGVYHLRINMADATYMSSAGIRILLKYYKQLNSLGGSFSVSNPSAPVKNVIELAGIGALLLSAGIAAGAHNRPIRDPALTEEDRFGVYELYHLNEGGLMRCVTLGNPGWPTAPDNHHHTVKFDGSMLGLGLGAFGTSYEECRDRAGEFLAVAGSAVYLPADGSNIPDYITPAGKLTPELYARYAITCAGEYSHFYQFECGKETGTIPLSVLIAHSGRWTGSDAFAFVLAGETSGLFGVTLRRSPFTVEDDSAARTLGGIRRLLSFHEGRLYSRCSALAVGVIFRNPPGAVSSFLRPVGMHLMGHVHAAALSYQSRQKGIIDLKSTVARMVEFESVYSVMHLLFDDRPGVDAVEESGFTRGAVWIGAIDRERIEVVK